MVWSRAEGRRVNHQDAGALFLTGRRRDGLPGDSPSAVGA